MGVENTDKADVSGACTAGSLDDKGWGTSTGEAEFRFADGSHPDELQGPPRREDLGGECRGHLTGGKSASRATGTATGTGLTGKMQWTGTYDLPTHK